MSVFSFYIILGEAAKDIICLLAVADDWKSETLYISTFLSCLHCCIWFDSIKVHPVISIHILDVESECQQHSFLL